MQPARSSLHLRLQTKLVRRRRCGPTVTEAADQLGVSAFQCTNSLKRWGAVGQRNCSNADVAMASAIPPSGYPSKNRQVIEGDRDNAKVPIRGDKLTFSSRAAKSVEKTHGNASNNLPRPRPSPARSTHEDPPQPMAFSSHVYIGSIACCGVFAIVIMR